MFQTNHTIYRDAGEGLRGQQSAAWTTPGAAATASFIAFRAELMPYRAIKKAFWEIHFDPDTDANQTCVGLFKHDGLSAPEYFGHHVCYTNYHGPKSGLVDITAAMQQLFNAAGFRWLGHQTWGNGSNGPLIYTSEIVIVWAG